MLLLLFWAGQVAAAIVAIRRWRRGRPGDRLLAAIAPTAAMTALAAVAIAALEAPYSPWDVVRLAPTIGLARGFPLYSGRQAGPILSTMYGPFSALAFLPAALVSDPAAAAIVARVLAAAFFFVPLALIGAASEAPARLDRWLGAFLLASLAALASPALGYSALQVHSDAPALGLAGLACWLAIRPGDLAAWPRAWAVAALAWLAVWSKQTMAPVPLALPIWAFWAGGRRAGGRLAIATAATGGLLAAAFLLAFDRDAMIFNAVTWPGHLPWKGSTPANLAWALVELAAQALPFAAVAAAGLALERDAGARRRLALLIGLALAMVPMALLGRVKKGGDVNSFSPTLYPLLLAATASAVRALESPRPLIGRAAARLTAAGLLVLTAWAIPRSVDDAKLLARLRPARAEYAYLRTHPGEVYFPWHPLAHLAAEGRATHHLHSAWERGVAGFPITRAHLLSAIPPGCRYVCFPLKRFGPVAGFGWSFEILEYHDLLSPDTDPVRIAGLPDYECYALNR